MAQLESVKSSRPFMRTLAVCLRALALLAATGCAASRTAPDSPGDGGTVDAGVQTIPVAFSGESCDSCGPCGSAELVDCRGWFDVVDDGFVARFVCDFPCENCDSMQCRSGVRFDTEADNELVLTGRSSGCNDATLARSCAFLTTELRMNADEFERVTGVGLP